MRKILFALFAAVCIPAVAFSQKDTLTGDAAKELLSQLKIDSTSFLSSAGHDACKCIDSITLSTKKSKAALTREIADCIDAQVGTYQLMMKMFASMTGKGSNNISLNQDKKSNEYQTYYFEIERWLKDSCASLNQAVASNNEISSKHSMSKNDKALGYYNKGVTLLRSEEYGEAIPWFEKAVKEDDKFAFAWDNLGICYRKINKLDEALAAYNKSLEADPDGITPLQNIPVVYQYQKEYDKALGAYKVLQAKYPDNPEGFYGSSLVYLNNEGDYENALTDMCRAYKLYVSARSPYRSDAEKVINMIYSLMKKEGKEKRFYEILEQYQLKPAEK